MKFKITITETAAYSVDIDAHDAEAAYEWAVRELAATGVSTMDFDGVIERDIDVSEVVS